MADSSLVRFAVVGLGHFAQAAILPAFANAKQRAELKALVTGDAKKAEELSKKYNVPAYGYDAYEELLQSGDIDAVYVATPNSEHCKYAVAAANAGIHVLCEKPLAYTSDDAERMTQACREGGVKLMTAYRLHFEEGNLQAIELAHNGKIGEPRLFDAIHTMQVAPGNIRIDGSLGGGPVEDIGIYCLNAARYIFRGEPEEVFAFAVQSDDPRFAEVPEAVSVSMRFSGDRLGTFLCGFGETNVSEYRVIGTEGILKMDPAYTWQGDIEQTIKIKEKEKTNTYKHRDQIAAEILYFAECIQSGNEPEPSGHEGLIDVKIIEAIRKSYTEQKPVRLEAPPKEDRPDASQSIKRQPHGEVKPVHASPPSNK